MPPSTSPLTTHYALVIDAGSSGSRLQIYSWRDPDLERAEILREVQEAQLLEGKGKKSKGRWWWGGEDGYRIGKGKGKEREMEEKALRRLVRVGKGVEGDDWVKRVEPGISTVNPDDIIEYLAPLLSHALQHIPPSAHANTPIYLLATAGMRLIPQERRDAVLKATCDNLRDSYPFQVDGPSDAGPCGESVRVISGEEEGMWGWVAVNYLMDGFGHAPTLSSSSDNLLPLAPLADPPPDSSSSSVTPVDVNHHSPTFGFLDMGGASTQLAFSPSPSELESSGFPVEDLRTVGLKLLSGEEVEWPVFVASWLGFGTNRARERYTTALLESWAQAHPNPTGKDLSTPLPDPCLPSNLQTPSTSPDLPGLIGTGSFSQCLESLVPLLEHSTPCPTEHCLFAGQPTPRIDFERHDQRGFIGISEYWYTMEHILGVGGVWDWGEWEKGMSEFCGKQWGEIEKEMEEDRFKGVDLDPTRLEMQCFKGAWISNVLHEGIGIPRLFDVGGNDTLTGGDVGDTNAEAERRAREKGLLEGAGNGKHHFQSVDEIGETAISWTLGKMVIEASKAVQPRDTLREGAWTKKLGLGLPAKLEDRLEDMGIQVVWAYAFLAFVLLACAFGRKKRYTSTPGRRRKPSISDPYGSSSNTTRMWPFSLWAQPEYSVEDGPIEPMLPAGKRLISGPGRLRLYTRRFSNLLFKHIPFLSPPQHQSSYGLSQPRSRPSSANLSQFIPSPAYSAPSSPRTSMGFFVPAHQTMYTNGLMAAAPIGGRERNSLTPDTMSGVASASSISPVPSVGSSPPSMSRSTLNYGRPLKSRQNSYHIPQPAPSPSGGWNDPPSSMLLSTPTAATSSGSSDPLSPPAAGVLTPTANHGSLQTGARDGLAGMLSRNSSRVGLNELGLAQRSMSRAGTPGFE
ncbi:hypothetical protein I350_03192 [Cryptococcus amylolentus CBS 6273]|uniref:Golgi apyrase n=1 Tax=Cryptococcus amylolentus CBS 6273 TaxID=1296118 RepID=A0A1E3KAM8_9TREE|nr:hypothetical protein I350_03192 [Cryptococcus amylolentus CBS 6273]